MWSVVDDLYSSLLLKLIGVIFISTNILVGE